MQQLTEGDARTNLASVTERSGSREACRVATWKKKQSDSVSGNDAVYRKSLYLFDRVVSVDTIDEVQAGSVKKSSTSSGYGAVIDVMALHTL
ncbi:hypothetical protein RRG08_064064 [Elysia crispata]|uniref:Uncharacterized protein n=1 Tax=Elysia crispata TaxID=231223 RepID=A0AAE0YEX9_9GAST|nr:hypothetical protein RRG08_064064 [Elysia crispata]